MILMGSLGAPMVIVVMRTGRIGSGLGVTTSIVASSTFTTLIVKPENILVRALQSSFGFSALSMELAMASGVSGVPSLYLMPLRRVKRQVVSFICFHDVASRGLSVLSLGSSSISVSLTFWRMTRPTAERALLQLSRLSGSSGMTMVMVLCANAVPGAINAKVISAASDTEVMLSWRKLIRDMAMLSSHVGVRLELTNC